MMIAITEDFVIILSYDFLKHRTTSSTLYNEGLNKKVKKN